MVAEWKLQTPVGLMIFNRPQTTRRVLDAIRQLRPPRLYVSADGPRPHRPDDREKCAATRAVIETVDWDCEVFKNYSDENLGCGLGESSGFDWIFEHEPEAIFLEDDTLPHHSFFRFCEEMLARYRDDERVMHISGSNLLLRRGESGHSYHFSRYPFCWGWASWRRAWKFYDLKLAQLPEIAAEGWLKKILVEDEAVNFWMQNFESVYDQPHPHTWDYQWVLTCWLQNGLSVIPSANLVTNIGFGQDATHTMGLTGVLRSALNKKQFARQSGLPVLFERFIKLKPVNALMDKMVESPFSNVPLAEMSFPLRHPPFVVRDSTADDQLQRQNYQGGRMGAVKRRLKSLLLD